MGPSRLHGVVCPPTGRPVKLLKWHVEPGFLGVPGSVLKKVYSHFDIEVPVVESSDEIEELNLDAGLMKHFDASLSADAVEAILVRRAIHGENPSVKTSLTDDDVTASKETMNSNDNQLLYKFSKSVQKGVERLAKTKEFIHIQARKLFPAAKKKAKSKVAVGLAKFPKTALKSRTAWFAADAGSSFLERVKPDLCSVTVDEHNGRY